MGTRIPEIVPTPPVPPGEPCPFCWGEDKEFGNVPTPSTVSINFSGISKGPNWQAADGEPPEGDFDVPQNVEEGPCNFHIRTDIDIELNYAPTSTLLFGSKVGGFGFFFSIHEEECINVLSSSLDDHFSGGTAVVTLPETG